MPEEPKRLTPTFDTARELYLKSGNECAYPSCDHRIVNDAGVLVAELCHIEAALPGGERFNPLQTNEERRSFANLMLMCHMHHKITDDVATYTVERLREMKATHEAKFTNVVERIRASITDQTALDEIQYAGSLIRWESTVRWGLDPTELAPMVEEIHDFAERLKRLPLRTREFLTVVLERGQAYGYLGDEWSALFDDIVEATHLSSGAVAKHLGILEHHELGHGEEDEGRYSIVLSKQASGWHIWEDLKKFAAKTKVPLREILVELRFNLLD
jgi:hypothetical protein